MSLVCGISGNVPDEPVISPASGTVFEKRLIEKHLDDNDTDPVNGESLAKDQLIAVNASKIVRPRAPTAASIPTMLKMFQDEWDSTMLETFKLRQHVNTVRQELTHALYQHDAACRVIARLTRERDEARHALATMQPAQAVAAPQHADSGGMDVEVAAPAEAEDGMTDEVIAKLTKTAKTLSKQRKKRSKPAELATADQIKQMAQSKSQTGLHGSSAQITSMSLGNVTNGLLLTGGSDKKAVLFDTDAEKVIATMTGHKKKVTDVALHPSADVALTCSNDATVKVWTASAGAELQSVATHSADVTGISLHPTGDYFVSASSDRHWGFHSVETGQTLAYYTDESVTSGLTCAQVHPDGMIFATGTADNMVHVWDIKEQKKLTTFNDHSAPVTSVTFSENGYYMATASSDALIKLYDLRKIDNFHTIEMEAGNKINSISFDHSGSYLMAGGNDIRVYASKTWEHLKTLDSHKKAVTSVAFGQHAQSIFSTSADRSLKQYTF